MKLHDPGRRIDRITVALLVDWTLFGLAPIAGIGAHIWAYVYLRHELQFDDIDAPTFKTSYSIYVSALWIGVLLIMGMARIRIILREIRRDALEREVRLGPVDSAAHPEHLRRTSTACPECGQQLKIPNGYRHHRAQCRACGHTFSLVDVPETADANA